MALLLGGLVWHDSRSAPSPAASAFEIGGDALALTSDSNGRATALRRNLHLSAADYAAVEVELDGGFPTTSLMFLWTTSEAPGIVRGAPLVWSGDRRGSLPLAALPHWRARVSAVGIGATPPFPVVSRLRLAPHSRKGSVVRALREWSGFEGLSAHSANFVIGGADSVPARIGPVPAAAAWVGLALLLHLLLAALRSSPPDRRVAAALVLGGWILLDARWQRDLWRQLERTRSRYAGLTWEQKRLAAEDGELFRLAQTLERVLPAAPSVVYVVTRDPEGADRYLALRARYHLLPHNVCSYYAVPPPEWLSGEYLLVFGARPDLRFEADTGQLHVDGDGRVIAAFRVLEDPLASLYRRR